MSYFTFILTNNIVPIFLVIGAGALFNYFFQLDIKTLSRINLYIMVPAFMFNQLYKTEISMGLVGDVVLFMVLFLLLLYIIGHGTGKLLGYDKNMENIFTNSIMFYNSGNYGIPLVTLAFKGDPLAVSIQIIVMVMQNMSNFTIGAFQAGDKGAGFKRTLLETLKLPSLYVIALALSLRLLHIQVWQPIMTSLGYISQAMIAVALLTLGAQLASTKFQFQWEVLLSNAIRLVGGPVIAFIMIYILGYHGLLAQVLVISAGLPTAVNTVLLALEYDSEPDFASEVVFSATLLSAFTEAIFIYVAQHFIA